MSDVKEKLEKLNDEILKIPGMTELSEATNVPAGAFVFGGLLISVVLIAFELPGAAFLGNLIGSIYPLYKSILALETEDKEDDKQWLTYWMIFALF